MSQRKIPSSCLACLAAVALLLLAGRASALDNVALAKPATQSSEYGGYPASNAVDGSFDNFTHTNANDAAAWWEVNLEESVPISDIRISNRGGGCCQSRLRDIIVTILDAPTIDGGIQVFTSDLLNPENVLAGGTTNGPKELVLDLIAITGAPVDGGAVLISRISDPDLSGSGGQGNADEASVLSMGEVEVYGAPAERVATVVRDIGADSITNGVFAISAKETEVPVTISVEAKVPNTAVKVVEVLPAGTAVGGITEGGQLSADTIVWDLPAVTSKSLAYQLVMDATCSLALDYPGSTFVAAGQEGKIRGDLSLARDIADGPLGTWTSEDIGTTGGAALATGAHDLMVKATGAGVGSNQDAFHFIHPPATTDFDVSFRLDCWNGTGQPRAGLMVRASTAANASMLFFTLVPPAVASGSAGNLAITWRKKTGNTALPISIISDKEVDSLPVHLKLARKGATLVASRSPDGVTWTDISVKIGTETVTEIPIGSSANQVDLGADALNGIGAGAWGVGSASFTLSAVSGPEFTAGEQIQPPSGVTAVGGSKQVALSWNPPAAGPVPTSYAIFRDGSALTEVAGTACTDSDASLAVGTEYCYTVKSKAGAQTSAVSNQSCGTPTAATVNWFGGDGNGDGKTDISDAAALLTFLYVDNTATLACLNSMELTGDSKRDISDAVFLLTFLFVDDTTVPYGDPTYTKKCVKIEGCGVEDPSCK